MHKIKRQYINNFIAIAVTVCLLVVVLAYLTDLTELNTGDDHFGAFFEEEEYDVLFFGTSHMVDGIYPMELWDDYGITSYNLGWHACLLPTSYWVLEMALEYTQPKLVVIDCFQMEYQYKIGEYLSATRIALGAFPFSMTKMHAVMDLLNDENLKELTNEYPEIEEGDALSLLWDFAIYHSRWNEIEDVDFYGNGTAAKGAELNSMVIGQDYSWDEGQGLTRDDVHEEDTVGIEYLEKMIARCQGEGIEVLLINLPFDPTDDQVRIANRAYDIADKYGVNYLNFLELDLVDMSIDGADYTHVNPSGAKKITSYLGAYIAEQYGLADHRKDSSYSSWDASYDSYLDFKVEDLRDQTELEVYLALLYDDDYDVQIEVANQNLYLSLYYMGFLENLGIDPDRLDGVTTISILSGAEEILYGQDAVDLESDLRITVCNHETGEVLDITSWSLVLDVSGDEQYVVSEGVHEL